MYSTRHTLKGRYWNNLLSFEAREKILEREPILTVPSLIQWTVDDVRLWDIIVFEEIENGAIKSCVWLEQFVEITDHTWRNIIIFDNHNHALYFWLDAVRAWIVQSWFELIHIDEHSDLWDNENSLDLERAIADTSYAWEFTNIYCNVGNYIQPALKNWLVHKMIRIENEFQIDEYANYIPPRNAVLNIDLDIFSPELEYIPRSKKMKCIKNLMKYVTFVTIATSPYFIDQWIALKRLRDIIIEET